MLDFFRVRPKKRSIKKLGKNGVLFNNPGGGAQVLFSGANLLLVGAMIYLGYLYWPLASSIIFVKLIYRPPAQAIAIPTPVARPTEGILQVWEYRLVIPKIGAEAKLATKVSPFNSSEYLAVLDEGKVAHAKGTPLPGEQSSQASFLFAHSTNQGLQRVRNNAIFYLLGEMEKGDQIVIYRNDEPLEYEVSDKKIVSAKDISYLNYRDDAETGLIVQTCWPIGTDWRRLIVMAKRK